MNARTLLLLLALVALLLGGLLAMRKLGQVEESRRQTLVPRARAAFDGLRSAMATKHGIELVLVSARRTEAEQAKKVASGRSQTDESWHEVGRAVDVQTARRDAAGKLVIDAEARDIESYRLLHQESKAFGWRGIPNGSPFKADGSKAYTSNGNWDVYHLQLQEGFKTVAEARAADDKARLA